ncbi:MAG: hypothetical protein WAU45_07835 [Blastocatellia bacterium]
MNDTEPRESIVHDIHRGLVYAHNRANGESHQDFAKTKANLANLPKVDPKEWVCPAAKKAK